MEQNKSRKIEQEQTFGCYDQNFISGKETRH